MYLNPDYTIDYTVTTRRCSVVKNDDGLISVPTLPHRIGDARTVFFVLGDIWGTNLIPHAHPYIPGGL